PGVDSVTVSENGLFSGTQSETDDEVEGYTAATLADKVNESDRVGPNYFEVVGTPVLQGRGIGLQDAENAQKVAVINEKMARFYFPKGNAIGKHIIHGTGKDQVAFTIVGVVRDAKERDLRAVTARRFYTAYLQHLAKDPIDATNFEIRTRTAPAVLKSQVRQVLAGYNPKLPALSIETANKLIDDTLVEERMIAKLSGFFGAIALTLAAMGLYGVMSYITARRTMEIGIRFALGAGRWSVMGMVMRDTFRLVVVGLIVGIFVSIWATRLFAKSLFGLSPFDPFTSLAAAVLLIFVAAIAAYFPAWRASRVDPMVALRFE
ncbi:MAG: ABC transporter permease, partial [Acidobacteriaceae bacterium]|nr:ABC transporter permease [Acidobacteriaceae bacterium]